MFSVIIYTETLLPVLSLYSRVAAFRVGMGGGGRVWGFWGMGVTASLWFRLSVQGPGLTVSGSLGFRV